MERREIVVIGAGMAGLACARRLADAGRDVLVLDKGRGLGGRMATRRMEAGPLDHGAPWLEARAAPFGAVIERMVAAGHAAPWTGPGGVALHVGMPGMSGAVRGLAAGLEVRREHAVREARRVGGGWRLFAETPTGPSEVAAGILVCTVPAPQVLPLLADEEPGLAGAVGVARLSACWTLLAVLDPPAALRPIRAEGEVAWLSDEGSKPGRAPGGVVLQASAGWTARRLEMTREEAVEELTALLRATVGREVRAAHAAAHRWRYALVEAPAGRPFLAGPMLRVGGDWCLGPRVEDAWTSSIAIAEDLLAAEPVRA